MEFIYNLAKEYNLLLELVIYILGTICGYIFAIFRHRKDIYNRPEIRQSVVCEFKPKELDKGTTFLKTNGKYIIANYCNCLLQPKGICDMAKKKCVLLKTIS